MGNCLGEITRREAPIELPALQEGVVGLWVIGFFVCADDLLLSGEIDR